MTIHCASIQDIHVNVQINQEIFNNEISQRLHHSSTAITNLKNGAYPVSFDMGIDEVGRGPLYGNVVVGAVILPSAWSYSLEDTEQDLLADTALAGLGDSKKISEKKRTLLKPNIESNAIGYATVDVPAKVIDASNIYQATLLGMKIASETLIITILNSLIIKNATLNDTIYPFFNLLIDGNALPKFEWQSLLSRCISTDNSNYFNSIDFDIHHSIQAQAWVKGDARHTAIAAASVIAKVRRDSQLIWAGEHYPQYGFEKHKGYPTKVHLQALQQYGALPEHRRSFKPVQRVL